MNNGNVTELGRERCPRCGKDLLRVLSVLWEDRPDELWIQPITKNKQKPSISMVENSPAGYRWPKRLGRAQIVAEMTEPWELRCRHHGVVGEITPETLRKYDVSA